METLIAAIEKNRKGIADNGKGIAEVKTIALEHQKGIEKNRKAIENNGEAINRNFTKIFRQKAI